MTSFFLRISAVLFAISAHSQFGNFDDQFTFTGATPSVQSKTTQYGLDCGIQSLTLRWYRVQNEYYYVNSYSLQVRDNGQWKTIRTISKGRSSYSVTINSFENGWNDSEANFNFRVRVNVNLEDVNDVNYSQGSTLKVADWCFGPKAVISLQSATVNSGNRTWNIKNGEKPTIYVNNSGAVNTDYFTVETKTVTGGTNFGSRGPEIRTFVSDCPRLGVGCNNGNISTEEYGFKLIAIPNRVPSGTESFRRSRIRLKVNDYRLLLRDGRTYYLHAVYSIGGTNSGNFVWPFRVEYKDNTSSGCTICPKPIENFPSRPNPYQVEIFDFTGTKIITKKVSTKAEEDKLIDNLPKKLYIVKNKYGTRKVHY